MRQPVEDTAAPVDSAVKNKMELLFGLGQSAVPTPKLSKPSLKRTLPLRPVKDTICGIKRAKLTDDQIEFLLAKKSERDGALKLRPNIKLTERGHKAAVDSSNEPKSPVPIANLLDFLIFAQNGMFVACNGSNANVWASISKYKAIKKVIFFIIEGMSADDYLTRTDDAPILSSFDYKVFTVSSYMNGSNVISSIALMPLPTNQLKKIRQDLRTALSKRVITRGKGDGSIPSNEKKNKSDAKGKPFKSGKDVFPRTRLLLSPEEMIQEGYPLPFPSPKLKKSTEGYKRTKDVYWEVTDKSPMYSVDTESCTTTVGNEMTRVSIINENFEVIYDTLVKPYNRIVNYLTPYSGITAKMLNPVTTRLEQVQEDLRRILPPDVILMGQSLNFDLHALKMLHPFVIDTSVCFNLTGLKNRKSKLKNIILELLSESIQCAGQSGHDSVEDAAACMKLVQAKLKNRFEWGNAYLTAPSNPEKALQQFRKQNKIDVQSQYFSSTLSHMSGRVENKILLVTNSTTMDNYRAHLPMNLPAQMTLEEQPTNETIVSHAIQNAPKKGYTIIHLDAKDKSTTDIKKVDQLVAEHRKFKGNVLTVAYFPGRPNSSDHGIAFVHLEKKKIKSIDPAKFGIKV